MRFKRQMKLEHGLRQIDIAPLVDVVFQLLIFFMLTSSFIIQPSIRIKLPKAVTSEVMQERNLEILVSAEGIFYIAGRIIQKEELKSLIKQAAQRQQAVLIKADRRAALGRIVELWDLCRQEGVSQINIATNQE